MSSIKSRKPILIIILAAVIALPALAIGAYYGSLTRRISDGLTRSRQVTHFDSADGVRFTARVRELKDYQAFDQLPVQLVQAVRTAEGDQTMLDDVAQSLSRGSTPGEEPAFWQLESEALSKILASQAGRDRITELFINRVYLGKCDKLDVYGLPEASTCYLGKSLRDLSLGETAFLVGIIRLPSTFSNPGERERAMSRRLAVLKSMLGAGLITQQQLDAAASEKVGLKQWEDEDT
jgi:membrane carboxypeptidase/penicillin-binding protein